MKTILVSLIGVLVLTLVVREVRAADEEQAVKAGVAEFAAAWNRHDAKAMASFWTEDGDLIDPFGHVAKGRNEVEQLFAREQSGVMKATTHQMAVSMVRALPGDIVLVDVESTITGMQTPDGKELPVFKPHVFLVYKLQDGKWMVVAARPYKFDSIPGPPK